MIVSSEHRFVFVEVPLTGSTAIAEELLGQYGCTEILHKHAHLSEYRRQASPSERRYSVVAGTRHPLDQILSYYTKLKNNHRGAYTDPERFTENGGWVTLANRDQFRFISDPANDFAAFLQRYFLNQSPRISQFAWGRSRYNHLIRFETLDTDFKTFLRAQNIPPKRDLPLTNPTTGRAKDFLSAYPEHLHVPVRAAFGPLAAEWGYSLPTNWAGSTPLKSRAAYALKNLLGRTATELLRLTPRDYQRLRNN